MAKKKKQQGHYCRICGEYKANEQFSGKGHARHICKECQSLPEDVKADMVRCNEVERAAFKYPMSRQDWELLEKYAKKYKDKESGQFAQDMLDMKRGNQTPDEDMEEDDVLIEGIYEEETIPFAELEDDIRYQMEELLADNINEFMIQKDYIPEGKELKDINEWVIKETRDTFFIKVILDAAYDNLVEEIINRLVKEWEEDSFEIITDPDSFSEVRQALEEAGIEMASAEVTMIPQTYVELTDEQDLYCINKILDLLDADDDVQQVYHNWDE